MVTREAKRQTGIPISFLTKIVQGKRGVPALARKPRVAKAAQDLCEEHDSLLIRTKALSGDSAASFLITLWQKTHLITLIIGFDTAGEGHKKFALAVGKRKGLGKWQWKRPKHPKNSFYSVHFSYFTEK